MAWSRDIKHGWWQKDSLRRTVINYQENFAPVAKWNSIRILLSIATNLEWLLQQLDAKNAFLNGDLEEEVYMDVMLGFEGNNNLGKVCKLLYGLKYSLRA